MRPLYEDIKKGDKETPIKRLKKKYKHPYYSELLENKDNEGSELYDDVILTYISCRVDAKILIIFNDSLDDVSGLIHKKMVNMSRKAIISLFHQIGYNLFSTYSQVVKRVSSYNFPEINKVNIYIYEGGYTPRDNMKYIMNRDFAELMLISRIFLNNNSLKLLEMQILERLYSLRDTECRNIIDKCINVNKGISMEDSNGMIITSGAVLYVYGLRECSDVDIFYKGINEVPKILEVDWKEIENYLVIDVCGEKINRETSLLDSRYYMYYMGIKIYTLDMEMSLRRMRTNRPRAIGDVIGVNELLGLNYKIPSIKKDYSGFKLKKFKDAAKVIAYQLRKFGIKLKTDEIKDLVMKYY